MKEQLVHCIQHINLIQQSINISSVVQMQEEVEKKLIRDKINNIDYVKGKLLGTGGFAKCFQCINQTDQKIYAAKVIPKKSINEKRQRYKLLVEIKIHRSLKHKHIVEFLEAFEDRQNVYILLEYCRNYTLKDLVKRRKRLTQYQAKIYTLQIVKAVQYIHSQAIVHRDLKLGNILINDLMDTKICDFGLSTRVKHEGQIKKTICGTPNYIAPQILEENGHSYEVDIWSIGVILYTLLFGKPPFEDNTVEQTYQNIKHNRFRIPDSIPVSVSAKDLINKILVTDPSKRIGLDDIVDHQFMQFPDSIPKCLPASTLAVPPFKFSKIEPHKINLYDVNLQMSQQLSSYLQEGDTNNFMKNQKQSGQLYKSKQKSRKPKQAKITYSYIRECFFMGDHLGYLLSSGIVGAFDKQKMNNLILQFGQGNFYIISKSLQQQPIKKSIPANDFQLHSLFIQDSSHQLQQLLNFKSYFITKYGVFRLEQLRKKQMMSRSAVLLFNKNVPDTQEQEHCYIKKVLKFHNGEIVTRLSNGVIQLHFNDLTSLFLNRQDEKGLFFVNTKGRVTQVNYNQCQSNKLRTKVRKFSNLMRKLSEGRAHEDQQYQGDDGQEYQAQSQEQESGDEDSY